MRLPFRHSRSCGAEWSWTTAYGFSVHCTTTTYTTAPWWHSFDSCDTTFVASHCSYPFLWPRWMCPRPSFHRTSALFCGHIWDLNPSLILQGWSATRLHYMAHNMLFQMSNNCIGGANSFLSLLRGLTPAPTGDRLCTLLCLHLKCSRSANYHTTICKKISHKPFSDLCETSASMFCKDSFFFASSAFFLSLTSLVTYTHPQVRVVPKNGSNQAWLPMRQESYVYTASSFYKVFM